MSLPPELPTGLDHKAVLDYVNASAMTLQVYDFFQTLELEVKYIWSARWTRYKAFYLFMKYLSFVDISLMLIRDNAYMHTSTCRTVNNAIGWLFYVGIWAAEVILTLRTWILYGRPRWLACVLCVVHAFMLIYEAIETCSIMNAIQFIEAAQPPCASVCLPSLDSSSRMIRNWLVAIVYDAFLCILLIIRACVESNHERLSRPVHLIYRDGIMYYIYFLFLMLLLLLFKLKLQGDVLVPMAVIGRVLYPLLTTRVVLHFQQQLRPVNLDDTNVLSTIEY